MTTPAPPIVNDGTRLRQNSRVACRVYDGLAEVITLDEPIRQHRLNAVGTRIWELSEMGVTVADVAARIAAEYAVDEDTARRDARDFCRDLVARGILVVAAEGAR